MSKEKELFYSRFICAYMFLDKSNENRANEALKIAKVREL